MPTNLYGPGDNYHPQNSHVIPALIRRIHEAKTIQAPEVKVWGTGTPKREFLYVEDLAAASTFLMNLSLDEYKRNTLPMRSHINVGYGTDISIKDLALKIQSIIGYSGRLIFDASHKDGSPQKLMNTSLLNKLGWQPCVNIDTGIKKTYEDFLCKNDAHHN
jgi:GDP-L-fucose synthase